MVEGLDDIREGGDVLRAYVGGASAGSTGVGRRSLGGGCRRRRGKRMSPLFLEERHDRGFALLLDAGRVPGRDELEPLLWQDGTLRPIEITGE